MKSGIRISGVKYSNVASMSPVLEQAVQNAVQTSLYQVRDIWKDMAKSRLHSAKNEYLDALGDDSITITDGGLSGKIKLTSSIAKLLEEGTPPYDLKDGFRKSSKVKVTKTGDWYLDVPIRYGTPNSTTQSSNLPYGIYNVMKKTEKWGRYAGDGFKWSPVQSATTGYQYSTSVYGGLTKVPMNSAGRNLNTYLVWRRVSANSNAGAWIHPGFQGAHILDSIKSQARAITRKNIEDAIHEAFDV